MPAWVDSDYVVWMTHSSVPGKTVAVAPSSVAHWTSKGWATTSTPPVDRRPPWAVRG